MYGGPYRLNNVSHLPTSERNPPPRTPGKKSRQARSCLRDYGRHRSDYKRRLRKKKLTTRIGLATRDYQDGRTADIGEIEQLRIDIFFEGAQALFRNIRGPPGSFGLELSCASFCPLGGIVSACIASAPSAFGTRAPQSTAPSTSTAATAVDDTVPLTQGRLESITQSHPGTNCRHLMHAAFRT